MPDDASPYLPQRRSLSRLREAVEGCRGCELWEPATQAVFGAGLKRARLMLVGEQPGDREDREGRPFVGPAGRVLDAALEDAGIDRRDVYVTNAVKHFKFEERGKRRIHQKPSARETAACRPWLDAEIQAVSPQALVCLGATAAQALLGREFRVSRRRGELVQSPLAPLVSATTHPSAVLRAPDEEGRRRERAALTRDLQVVARAMAEGRA